MNSIVRKLAMTFAVLALLIGASAARADTMTVTLGGLLTGTLNVTATPNGGGSYLITGLTGSETIGGTTMNVGGVVPTNASGAYWFPPPTGDGFTYDNLIFPGANTVFDNGGLLFTLVGSGGSIYENLYSVGTAVYLESAYLANGAPFPFDFTFVPTTVTVSAVSRLVVATPEPSTFALALAGILVFATFIFKKSQLA
jgi:hypothetical protein